jgi:selT/selW/selH-like putative selenoprotein
MFNVAGKPIKGLRKFSQTYILGSHPEILQYLLSSYGQRLNKNFSVTLDTGDGGVFEVYVDGVKVFSRHEQRRFPTHDEIAEQIEKRLQEAKTSI